MFRINIEIEIDIDIHINFLQPKLCFFDKKMPIQCELKAQYCRARNIDIQVILSCTIPSAALVHIDIYSAVVGDRIVKRFPCQVGLFFGTDCQAIYLTMMVMRKILMYWI